ncbi:winged helix-turn-helix transcriptional regulator [Candidatus Woesearchaeota archaeon]|nr:winged helix-turn-helix transcriptional regulator [Candidatus Woesearchaeota archaeon]
MSSDIVLDRLSFKALASGTRISIIKLLLRRKHTLMEISSSLNLAHPSVKDHMTALVSASLVERFDEGRKWKYYGLTSKGRGVLQPERKTILLLLALTIFSAGGFALRFFSNVSFGTYSAIGERSQIIVPDIMPLKASESFESSSDLIVSNISQTISNGQNVFSPASASSGTDGFLIFFAVLFIASTILLLLYWWSGRRKY